MPRSPSRSDGSSGTEHVDGSGRCLGIARTGCLEQRTRHSERSDCRIRSRCIARPICGVRVNRPTPCGRRRQAVRRFRGPRHRCASGPHRVIGSVESRPHAYTPFTCSECRAGATGTYPRLMVPGTLSGPCRLRHREMAEAETAQHVGNFDMQPFAGCPWALVGHEAGRGTGSKRARGRQRCRVAVSSAMSNPGPARSPAPSVDRARRRGVDRGRAGDSAPVLACALPGLVRRPAHW
jgi:hypothetical protein